MKSRFPSQAIRKSLTLAVIACMCAGLLLGGSANAYVKPAKRNAATNPVKRVATVYPNLQRFALDLTKAARLGKLQVITGYDADISRVIETLCNSRMTPVLVGESNLDRSSVARGLAIRIASGDVPAAIL